MNGCVLFVDDEENILLSVHRLMDEWLEEKGYIMETASSVAQALSQLEADPARYHAVVSDLKMPNQVGTVLLKSVHERWPDISTILMTGYAEIDEIKKAIKSGIVAFIQKPWDPDLVRAEVGKALELTSLRRSNRDFLNAVVEEVAWSRKIHHSILMGDRELVHDSSIGVAYRAAQGIVEGGGDFFQVLWADQASVAVCLGTIDVKGAQGTYFALLIREMLGKLVAGGAKPNRPSPARILEALNQRILGNKIDLPGCFMNMTICATQPTHNAVAIASAGGESFFMVRNGRCEEHHLPSPGLGFRDGIRYQDREFPFRPGERLVLASRPLVNEPAIRERFLAALEKVPAAPAALDQTAEKLLSEILATGSTSVDATTIIVERPEAWSHEKTAN